MNNHPSLIIMQSDESIEDFIGRIQEATDTGFGQTSYNEFIAMKVESEKASLRLEHSRTRHWFSRRFRSE